MLLLFIYNWAEVIVLINLRQRGYIGTIQYNLIFVQRHPHSNNNIMHRARVQGVYYIHYILLYYTFVSYVHTQCIRQQDDRGQWQ